MREMGIFWRGWDCLILTDHGGGREGKKHGIILLGITHRDDLPRA